MQKPPEFEIATPPSGSPDTASGPEAERPKSLQAVADKEAQRPMAVTHANAVEIGRSIAAIMAEQDYHPVILFGSASSGKSHVLASLLAYLRSSADSGVQLKLGEPIMPLENAYARDSYDGARSFFDHVDNFLQGRGQGASRIENPFFIPAILTPKSNKPEIRLAFLESNGEWYQRSPEANAPFRQLRGEIEGLMQSFPKGMTFLHIASCTQVPIGGDPHQNQSADIQAQLVADEALTNCLSAYANQRDGKSQDAHMLLVTKWDAYVKPGDSSGHFFDPPLDLVLTVVGQRYPRAHAAFNNLNLQNGGRWQKQVMQYSAGLIFDLFVQKANDSVKDRLNTYSRTLLNYLYQNATRAGVGRPLELWPQPVPPKPSLGARIERFIARILKALGVG